MALARRNRIFLSLSEMPSFLTNNGCLTSRRVSNPTSPNGSLFGQMWVVLRVDRRTPNDKCRFPTKLTLTFPIGRPLGAQKALSFFRVLPALCLLPTAAPPELEQNRPKREQQHKPSVC